MNISNIFSISTCVYNDLCTNIFIAAFYMAKYLKQMCLGAGMIMFQNVQQIRLCKL